MEMNAASTRLGRNTADRALYTASRIPSRDVSATLDFFLDAVAQNSSSASEQQMAACVKRAGRGLECPRSQELTQLSGFFEMMNHRKKEKLVARLASLGASASRLVLEDEKFDNPRARDAYRVGMSYLQMVNRLARGESLRAYTSQALHICGSLQPGVMSRIAVAEALKTIDTAKKLNRPYSQTPERTGRLLAQFGQNLTASVISENHDKVSPAGDALDRDSQRTLISILGAISQHPTDAVQLSLAKTAQQEFSSDHDDYYEAATRLRQIFHTLALDV